MICTITLHDCGIGNGLLELRRDMVWRGLPVTEEFHASEDKVDVRLEVYRFIEAQNFRIDATILEKSKAQPHVSQRADIFYKYAVYYHLRHIWSQIIVNKEEVAITAASIGTKKGQAVFTAAVNEVLQQVKPRKPWETFFPRSVAEPCLQIADYCAWAIQRKWERGDERWYGSIAPKIETEFDLWSLGTTHFY